MESMRALVVGGTGTLGRHVVATLLRRGHDVRALSRHPLKDEPDPAVGAATTADDAPPVALVLTGDLSTGTGLATALEGVDVVIDCSNINTTSGRKATAFFTNAAARLREAERAAGVAHHVLISIVGIDDIPYPYYLAKLAQERAAEQSQPPVTILRSTQFMEFGPQVATRTSLGPLVFVPDWPVQPVAAADVAEALADIAEAPPAGRAPDLGGPDIVRLPDLVRSTLAARGTPERVVRIRVPGRAGRIMHTGGLLLGEGRCGPTTLADFLSRLTRGASPGDATSGA